MLTVALAIKKAASADIDRTSLTCLIIFLTLDMGSTWAHAGSLNAQGLS